MVEMLEFLGSANWVSMRSYAWKEAGLLRRQCSCGREFAGTPWGITGGLISICPN